jgi:hypothetical protein
MLCSPVDISHYLGTYCLHFQGLIELNCKRAGYTKEERTGLGLRGYEWPTRIKDVEEGLYATTS